jgi:hypothetical protein
LTPTSGNPPSGGEEGPEPQTRYPAGAAQQTPYTPASTTVAPAQEALCCDHRQNPPNLYRRSLTPAAGGYRYRVISAEEPTAAVAAPLRHLDRLTRNPAAGFAAGATVGLLGGLIGLGGAEFRLPLLIALYQSTVRPSRGSGPPLAKEVA